MTDLPPNPISDTNRNGALDIADFAALMEKEEEKGPERTPNERVHGLLDHAGIRQIVAEWNKTMLAMETKKTTPFDSNTPNDQALVNAYLNLPKTSADALTKQLNDEIVKVKVDPVAYLKEQEAKIDNLSLNSMQRHLARADAQSFVGFAVNFDKTFPQGINLNQNEILRIIGHFGPFKEFRLGIPSR